LTAEDIIERLQLIPLPNEGGFFRETYRTATMLEDGEGRAHGTAIYFFITPDQFSALHRLPIDEVWHFYMGDPVEQIRLHDDGTLETVILGNDLFAQPPQHPQSVVSAGIWQGTRLHANGRFALLGTTMAPGFEFSDLEMADGASLCQRYPEHTSAITTFTHS
jgi:predicted cupin superfamily sugar epimerase